MVLLTSSAISAAVSGGIVCSFTFLLFLSGYVLQQQTVRSLQHAIRNPPEKIAIPVPTLPPQFQASEEDGILMGSSGGRQQILSTVLTEGRSSARKNEISIRELWYNHIHGQVDSEIEDTNSAEIDIALDVSGNSDRSQDWIVSRESLAYIFALPDTNSLCSAVSFAKRYTNLTYITTKPKIVFVYPATWDVSDLESHVAAMDLIREMQDVLKVILHPVTISRVWAGIDIQQQLLAELQRYRWPYDRAMYLGSPGMAIDTLSLDQALAQSNTKAAWTLLHPNPKSREASHPPVLLWVAGRGLLYPRHEMKVLTSYVSRSHNAKAVVEEQAEDAAYVLFDEKELSASKSTVLSGGLFERFQQHRRDACYGTGLFDK